MLQTREVVAVTLELDMQGIVRAVANHPIGTDVHAADVHSELREACGAAGVKPLEIVGKGLIRAEDGVVAWIVVTRVVHELYIEEARPLNSNPEPACRSSTSTFAISSWRSCGRSLQRTATSILVVSMS